MSEPRPDELSDAERATYEWQMWTQGVGEAGQRKLRDASVLISRVGGVGGCVAYHLAAAGVGRLILAHAGQTKPSDLNRQLLMTHDNLGKGRAECAARRLRELNPRLDAVAVDENICDANADALLARADIAVDAAPLFVERFAINDAAVRARKSVVEAAIFDTEAQCTVIVPGQTPCLRCIVGENPVHWRRQFPVFSAVAGTIGAIAAFEVIKLITGIGEPLTGRILLLDLRAVTTRLLRPARDPACPACAHLH